MFKSELPTALRGADADSSKLRQEHGSCFDKEEAEVERRGSRTTSKEPLADSSSLQG